MAHPQTEHDEVDPAAQRPHALAREDLLERLEVDASQGLSDEEAGRRRARHGPNQLREARRRPAPTILFDQFKSVVVLVLVAALVAAVAFSEWPEAIAIAAVILVNTTIGFLTEHRAVRSMEALRRLGKESARVRRGGRERDVESAEIVPGDILLLEGETLVGADARLLTDDLCRVNEAALTGESVPVDKRPEPLDADAPLAERLNMLFKGTTVVEGRAEAVVVGTGANTELGRIAELAQEAEASSTPLQKRLDQLGRRLALIVLAITILVAGGGLLAGRETLLMIETAIALGVAAIPEGLPIVATLALARGMWLMARRHALINCLPAVETLGATRVICTDKTGTLTENRMTLRRVVTALDDHEVYPEGGGGRASLDDDAAMRLIEVGALCNNAQLPDEEDDESPSGDPTETALVQAAAAFGRARSDLLHEQPETREVRFDPDVMMMATFHRASDGFRVAVKGAPHAVLDVCDHVARAGGRRNGETAGGQALDAEQRDEWRRRAEELASEGLRVLAFAEKTAGSDEAEPYEGLCFLGLGGLLDPPREDARDAINTCQRAGVQVVMVTGDQAATAEAIAEAVGIVGDPEDPETRIMQGPDLEDLEHDERKRDDALRCNVFARVTPEQKLNLIGAYQAAGEVVAMTGDGVNDAPALRKADIGVAMGRRGTDAAKQVADMILTDDACGSIVAAVEQGRVIFANIRNAVMFMLCTNVAEVLAVAAASVAHLPLPLRPLQILYLNVLTDVFPALALAVTAGGPGVMDRPPRDPSEPVLTRRHWLAVGAWGGLIAAVVLAALLVALRWLNVDPLAAVTVSFLTLGMSKLWFVFNLRDPQTSFLASPIVRNPWVWGSIAFCAALLVAAAHLPGLSAVLETRSPGAAGWAVALALSLTTLAAGQVLLALRRRQSS